MWISSLEEKPNVKLSFADVETATLVPNATPFSFPNVGSVPKGVARG